MKEFVWGITTNFCCQALILALLCSGPDDYHDNIQTQNKCLQMLQNPHALNLSRVNDNEIVHGNIYVLVKINILPYSTRALKVK